MKNDGQPCRKCGTPVIKRARKPLSQEAIKRGKIRSIYTWNLWCPGCGTRYLVQEARVFLDKEWEKQVKAYHKKKSISKEDVMWQPKSEEWKAKRKLRNEKRRIKRKKRANQTRARNQKKKQDPICSKCLEQNFTWEHHSDIKDGEKHTWMTGTCNICGDTFDFAIKKTKCKNSLSKVTK